MDLVRDLLDAQVVDRHGRELGRVDGIVLDVRPDAPPRVACLEVGPAVLAARISPLLARWVEALEHGLGIDAGRPWRIGLNDVLDIGDHVKVDAAFAGTPAASLELRLRKWIGSLPGSSS